MRKVTILVILIIISVILIIALLSVIAQKSPKQENPQTQNQTSQQVPVIIYDISHFKQSSTVNGNTSRLEYYDRLLALESLQGIVNRNQPSLFLNYVKGYKDIFTGPIVNIDQNWFDKMCDSTVLSTCVSKYQNLNGRPLFRLSEIDIPVEELINQFYKPYIKGLVLWDKRVNATSNVAASIAGAEDFIALRYAPDSENSLLKRVENIAAIPIKINLFELDFTNPQNIPGEPKGSGTGSTKNNAYRWLINQYVTTGKLNPDYVGYYVDAFSITEPQSFLVNGLSHIDWLVKNRGMVFDLSMWGDEVPYDDPSQPLGTDLETFRLILSKLNAASSNLKYVHGFAPWPYKYTTHSNRGKHIPTEAEGEQMNLFSEYGFVNISPDAETGCCEDELGVMPNASFYSNLKSKSERMFLNNELNPMPLPKALENKTYLLFGLGDYDSPSWAYRMLSSTKHWNSDSGRGQIPLMWGFNTGIFELNPVLVDEIINTKTSSDYFTGWSGAGMGYANLNLFPNKSLIQSKAISEYQKYNLSISPLYIHTDERRPDFFGQLTPESLSVLSTYSGDGISMTPTVIQPVIQQVGQIPLYEIQVYTDWSQSTDSVINQINAYNPGATPAFVYVRAILNTPNQIIDVVNTLKSRYPERNYEVVDPYTFFYLLRSKNGVENSFRATYLSDDIPATMNVGETYTVSAVIRNDGWDVWQNSILASNYKLGKSFVSDGVSHSDATYSADGFANLPANSEVAPGSKINITFTIKAPENPGVYSFQMDMFKEPSTYFRRMADLPFTKTIEVVGGTK